MLFGVFERMVNKSTKFTPAHLLYGFELRTPAIWQPGPGRVLDEPLEETVHYRIQEMNVNIQELREQAAETPSRSQERQSARYNLTVVPRVYNGNNLMLLRVEQPTSISQSAKFSQLYEGPYTIVRPLLNGIYLLKDSAGAQDIVHLDRLKPYNAHTQMIPEVVSTSKPLKLTLWRFRLN
ncbi:hypothetical protein BC939DRAFT_442465 [Gamsiella multidivaricata]|uniref:uncharacterized protein n=1 Tax=Gamsiella multidivaricata TaxID=101098 RepID=UPI002220BF16|nr:uncharacterized protein BC939DRAFT_442465 [Gamsiella multidivaricata]KAI7828993.1 hypothetical protein BC939DRAFT_442465 [Gamsiella multidivaricata]